MVSTSFQNKFLAHVTRWSNVENNFLKWFERSWIIAGLLNLFVDIFGSTHFVTLGLMTAHAALTRGHRWVMYPVYCNAVMLNSMSSEHSMLVNMLAFIMFAISLVLIEVIPQPNIPKPTGPYKSLGVRDTMVSHPDGDVIVRFIYPTLEKQTSTIAYAKPGIGKAFIDFGTPPSLSWISFALKHWKSIRLDLQRDAPVSPQVGDKSTDIMVFSHGDGGTNTYMTALQLEYASHGHIIVSIEHLDGSASIAHYPDGRTVAYDKNVARRFKDTGIRHGYVWSRRKQLEIRQREVLRVLNAISDGSLGLEGCDTKGTARVHLVGHSYGGATVLTSLARNVHLKIASCIVYDAAIDWIPDDVRSIMFGENSTETPLQQPVTASTTTLANYTQAISQVPTLFIISEDWEERGIASPESIREAVRTGIFGRYSAAMVLKDGGHQSFTDIIMLISKITAGGLGMETESRRRYTNMRLVARATLSFASHASEFAKTCDGDDEFMDCFFNCVHRVK
eukprot:m.63945 g.63945  ORF g.63945 m.63945 type:complete len:507 (-) comp23369_c0_seq1:76-1596(-)